MHDISIKCEFNLNIPHIADVEGFRAAIKEAVYPSDSSIFRYIVALNYLLGEKIKDYKFECFYFFTQSPSTNGD